MSPELQDACDRATQDMDVLIALGVPWDVDLTDEVLKARCLPVLAREMLGPVRVYQR